MIKTVGIITCHTPYNYGAMLQAYGLQKYLASKGVYPEIIDYFPEIYKEELSLLYIGDKRYRNNVLFSVAYILLKLPSRLKRKFNFWKFKKQYLNISNHRYKSYDELKQTLPTYDTYICGSDQIWNTLGLRGWNPTFYLQFVKDKSKRNSYAASMSLNLPINEDVKTRVLPMIAELNKISVRERLIQQELTPLLDKKIDFVLDPVYLLSDKEWGELADKSRPIGKDYILIYPMGDGLRVLEYAKLLSLQTGLPIYCITASSRKFPGVTRHFNCDMPRFVRLFKDASYVLTNSFHGTAFSIIFRKNFWSCQVGANNHRITNIIKELHLSDRYIGDDENINLSNLPIDYSLAEKKLERLISESKNFLDDIVNG